MNPQPKPTKRPPKPCKPLRRGKPMARSPMRKSKRGTKHSRRPREFGFISFCHARGCELKLDVDTQRLLGIRHRCVGRLEFAHLSDLKRYDVGDVGACLDRTTHLGIDGDVGGKAPWYAEMEHEGQHLFRMRLANRARAAWDALTPEARAEWDRRAAAQRKGEP